MDTEESDTKKTINCQGDEVQLQRASMEKNLLLSRENFEGVVIFGLDPKI